MEKGQITSYRSSGYTDPERVNCGRIIVPDRLPVKVTIRGIRVLINVGELAFFPEGAIISIDSSSPRDIIDYDFELLKKEPEFTLLLPVLTLPYICRVNPQTSLVPSPSFGCIVPITLSPAEEKKERPAASVRDIARAIIAGRDMPLNFRQTAYRSLLMAMFTLIGGEIIAGISHADRSSETLEKLARAIACMNDNFSRELSLSEIAEEAGCSSSYLSHAFKESFGISPFDYLVRIRVAHATSLLLGKKLPMQEIAEGSGFMSSSTFNRSFRSETGLSPRDYLKLSVPKG